MHATKYALFAAVALVGTLAPAVAMADPRAAGKPTFYTTGGRTQLTMTTLRATKDGMVVRLSDKTKLAFNKQHEAMTVLLRRGSSNGTVPGWTLFEGQAGKTKWGVSMTVQDEGLRGERGALVGLTLTAYDPFLKMHDGYGVHFQLKN